MNCPTCQDLISFTDIYCNSCGEILNLLAVQQSDATNPTTIDYLSYPSDQETTIPKGSYSLRFTDTDYCDLFNENDEIICSYIKYFDGEPLYKLLATFLLLLLACEILFFFLLGTTNVYFLIIVFASILVTAFMAGDGILYNIFKREKGTFLDKNGDEIALLTKNSFGSKYYLKSLTDNTLLLIDFKKKFNESHPTFYSFKNIFWCRELNTQVEDYSVKNGTFLMTNDVEGIAFLDPTLSTIDPSIEYTGIVIRTVPQQCRVEVLKDNSNLLLVLTCAIVLVKKKYVGY